MGDERISAKELAAVESIAKDTNRGATEIVLVLVAEVRRLRSLVGRIAFRKYMDPKTCPYCWGTSEQLAGAHVKGCPWPEIEAEAEAQAQRDEFQ